MYINALYIRIKLKGKGQNLVFSYAIKSDIGQKKKNLHSNGKTLFKMQSSVIYVQEIICFESNIIRQL